MLSAEKSSATELYTFVTAIVVGSCACTYLFESCGESRSGCAMLYGVGLCTLIFLIFESALRHANPIHYDKRALVVDVLLALLVCSLFTRHSFLDVLSATSVPIFR